MKAPLNIFTLSDNHWLHEAINKLCHRGFKNLEHMDSTMITRWNGAVKPTDLVIHVGDIIFTKGSSEQVAKIIKQLNGRKILIRGNHDKKSYSWYLTHGFDFVCDSMVWNYNDKKILFIHNPNHVEAHEINKYNYVIHGHQHNTTPFITKKRNCTFLNVSVEHLKYYPMNLITLLEKVKKY